VRFKIDENLPVGLASLLSHAGHHAASVVAQQLQGKLDSIIVDVCVREKRVLLTHDLDFADIRAYPPDQYPGLSCYGFTSKISNALSKHLNM